MPCVKPSSHPWDISLLVTIEHFLNVLEFDSLVSYLYLYTYSQRWDLSRLLMLNLYFLNLFSSFTHPQFSSVAQLCPTLCNPMDCSTPGFPVHYQLLELAQTHVHWVGDAVQPSHPLLSPSPPAFNLSQHQGLFQWVSSSHQVAKVLELQHQSFQRIFRTDFL